jgi:hypothetical protein
MDSNRFSLQALREAARITPKRLLNAGVCLLFAFILLAMQYASGAFTADLAMDPDEPAHAVSSLMVRDYLTQGIPHNPVTFAWNFYAHYPKVAIGHWPPLFYCLEAIWMLVAGRSQAALLLFVTLCGTAFMASIFFEVRRRGSTAAAVVSVAILLSTRIFHQMLCGVRPDILLALMVFWAAVYCGEYMRFGLRRDRNLFLVFLVAALLVHGRGGALVLLPFILLPLRPKVTKWKWIVAGAVAMALFLVPQYIHQAPPNNIAAFPGRARDFILSTVFLTGWPWKSLLVDGISLAAGWPFALLAAFGLPLVFRKGPEQQFWTAMAGLFLCSLVFYIVVPVPLEYRFLLTAMQAVAVLAGGSVDVLLQSSLPYRKPLRVALCGAVVAWTIFAAAHLEHKRDLGYRQLVANCLFCGNDVVLIAGDEVNEGGLIVEASLADPYRAHTVLRASKLLASSGWTGWNRRLKYKSSSEVLHSLDQEHVSLVLVQKNCFFYQVVQLRNALQQDTTDWRLVPGPSAIEGMEFYSRVPPQAAKAK